jgi:hypothetical protein
MKFGRIQTGTEKSHQINSPLNLLDLGKLPCRHGKAPRATLNPKSFASTLSQSSQRAKATIRPVYFTNSATEKSIYIRLGPPAYWISTSPKLSYNQNHTALKS